ncbi:transcription initiation factor IIA large subunit-like, partial [Trifolium medium]|nr:transcription initiation factor IIA large subunit-like [Trifolium medium]
MFLMIFFDLGIKDDASCQAGAVVGPIERSNGPNKPTPDGPITMVHDLNVPYEGTEDYETATAEILFTP